MVAALFIGQCIEQNYRPVAQGKQRRIEDYLADVASLECPISRIERIDIQRNGNECGDCEGRNFAFFHFVTPFLIYKEGCALRIFNAF